MGRKKPHRLKVANMSEVVNAPLTRYEILRQLLLEQVERLARVNPGWDGELVRDLLGVNELVVGLEILADQMFECGAPYDPAFSVIVGLGKELGVGEVTLQVFAELAARFTTFGLVMQCREGGAHQQERHYRDFLIDGVALTKRLKGDQITVFDWYAVDVQRATLEQLSGRVAGALDGGRVALCVCPECGDLGCGAVSVRVEILEDAVIWREFGHQNNYQEGFGAVDLGPFRFERANYFAVLGELRAVLGRPRR